jgi:hypothetical protein
MNVNLSGSLVTVKAVSSIGCCHGITWIGSVRSTELNINNGLISPGLVLHSTLYVIVTHVVNCLITRAHSLNGTNKAGILKAVSERMIDKNKARRGNKISSIEVR